MIRSRLNWLLVPVAFTITYEALAWALWVPLSRSAVAARNGAAFIPYWEGQVFAFAAIRITGAMFVFLFCFLLPPLNRWRTFLVGVMFGCVTSIVDRFCWDWANHLGFLLALLAIPIVSLTAVMLTLRWIEARWGAGDVVRDGSAAT